MPVRSWHGPVPRVRLRIPPVTHQPVGVLLQRCLSLPPCYRRQRHCRPHWTYRTRERLRCAYASYAQHCCAWPTRACPPAAPSSPLESDPQLLLVRIDAALLCPPTHTHTPSEPTHTTPAPWLSLRRRLCLASHRDFLKGLRKRFNAVLYDDGQADNLYAQRRDITGLHVPDERQRHLPYQHQEQRRRRWVALGRRR